jgi:hypothetical protein
MGDYANLHAVRAVESTACSGGEVRCNLGNGADDPALTSLLTPLLEPFAAHCPIMTLVRAVLQVVTLQVSVHAA